jgi:hypothetical protein
MLSDCHLVAAGLNKLQVNVNETLPGKDVTSMTDVTLAVFPSGMANHLTVFC